MYDPAVPVWDSVCDQPLIPAQPACRMWPDHARLVRSASDFSGSSFIVLRRTSCATAAHTSQCQLAQCWPVFRQETSPVAINLLAEIQWHQILMHVLSRSAYHTDKSSSGANGCPGLRYRCTLLACTKPASFCKDSLIAHDFSWSVTTSQRGPATGTCCTDCNIACIDICCNASEALCLLTKSLSLDTTKCSDNSVQCSCAHRILWAICCVHKRSALAVETQLVSPGRLSKTLP